MLAICVDKKYPSGKNFYCRILQLWIPHFERSYKMFSILDLYRLKAESLEKECAVLFFKLV